MFSETIFFSKISKKCPSDQIRCFTSLQNVCKKPALQGSSCETHLMHQNLKPTRLQITSTTLPFLNQKLLTEYLSVFYSLTSAQNFLLLVFCDTSGRDKTQNHRLGSGSYHLTPKENLVVSNWNTFNCRDLSCFVPFYVRVCIKAHTRHQPNSTVSC